MSTILQICQDIAREISFAVPSALVSSSNALDVQFLAIAHDEVQKLRQHEWPQLSKTFSLTLATDTESYTLPADFDYWINRTAWDTSNDWELLGPLTAQEWQAVQQGLSSSGLRKKYRIQGFYTTLQNVSGDPIPGYRVKIHPTPTVSENGQILIKEYISTAAILPKQWVASTAYTSGTYVSNVGNVYKCDTNGTSAASGGPTTTAQDITDNTTRWDYQANPYDKFLADTDFPLISHKLIKAGIKWRMLQENGFEFGVAKAEYDSMLLKELSGIKGGRDINMVPTYDTGLLGYDNVPDSGYNA